MEAAQWDRVARYFGDVAFNHLRKKTVVVVGVGSGGSAVALYLAMTGVGKIILIDPETLSEHNVIRHVLDLRYVGQYKVDAMAELIGYRNPNANVKAVRKNIRDAPDELIGADLVLVCVDSEQDRHFINVKARELRIPAISAGMYEKGSAGDVILVDPLEGPCYSCIASVVTPTEAYEVMEGELDYGQVNASGALQGQPGLGIHVARVALMQTHLAVVRLLRDTDSPFDPLPGNFVLMANVRWVVGYQGTENTPVILEPGEALWQQMDRKSDCLVCMPNEVTDVSVDSLFTN